MSEDQPNYVDRRQWKYDPMTGNRLWQGLTDEDLWELVQKTPSFDETVAAVEAKLKQKNA
jgi:hypothetical protein